MLIAPRKPVGPEWRTIMGAQFLFAPIDRLMMRRARRAAIQKLRAAGRDAPTDADSDEDPAAQLEELGDALSEALIVEGLRDWRDVSVQRVDDDGNPVLTDDKQPIFDPLPFTPDNLAIVLSDVVTFDAIDGDYVMPFAARERAKNGFAASPIGTGEAVTPAANTASSHVTAKPQAAAKPARTGSKKPRPPKRKKSGRS